MGWSDYKMDEDYWEQELDRLVQDTNLLIKGFYSWCRRQHKFIGLWVRMNRKGFTLSIEWVVPRITAGKRTVTYIRKGKSFRYSHTVLVQHIKKQNLNPQQINYILNLESQLAEIRQLAHRLSKARRVWEQYQTAKIGFDRKFFSVTSGNISNIR